MVTISSFVRPILILGLLSINVQASQYQILSNVHATLQKKGSHASKTAFELGKQRFEQLKKNDQRRFTLAFLQGKLLTGRGIESLSWNNSWLECRNNNKALIVYKNSIELILLHRIKKNLNKWPECLQDSKVNNKIYLLSIMTREQEAQFFRNPQSFLLQHAMVVTDLMLAKKIVSLLKKYGLTSSYKPVFEINTEFEPLKLIPCQENQKQLLDKWHERSSDFLTYYSMPLAILKAQLNNCAKSREINKNSIRNYTIFIAPKTEQIQESFVRLVEAIRDHNLQSHILAINIERQDCWYDENASYDGYVKPPISLLIDGKENTEIVLKILDSALKKAPKVKHFDKKPLSFSVHVSGIIKTLSIGQGDNRAKCIWPNKHIVSLFDSKNNYALYNEDFSSIYSFDMPKSIE